MGLLQAPGKTKRKIDAMMIENVAPISVEVAKKMADRRSEMQAGKAFGRRAPASYGYYKEFHYTWTAVDTQGLFDETHPKSSGVWKVYTKGNSFYEDGDLLGPQGAFEAAGCHELDVYKYKDPDAEQHNHFIFVPKQISCGDESNTEFIPQDIFPGFVYSGAGFQKKNKRIYINMNKRLLFEKV
jgi:hypothetical protein